MPARSPLIGAAWGYESRQAHLLFDERGLLCDPITGRRQLRALATGQGRVVDLFAGGGGASFGIEWAIGRSPCVSVNHWPLACSVHALNHPESMHLVEGVYDRRPSAIVGDDPIDLLWMSPTCTGHSQAKGRALLTPQERREKKKIRALASVARNWASLANRPRIIFLENVKQFVDGGPIDLNGQPIKEKKGRSFRRFVQMLERYGYRVEWRVLVADEFGYPTRRERLFLIARCDGLPIRWPTRTPVIEGQARTCVVDCLDWGTPAKSLFGRRSPNAEKTLQRYATGVVRFVIQADRPFIAPECARVVAFDKPESAAARRKRGTPGARGHGYGRQAEAADAAGLAGSGRHVPLLERLLPASGRVRQAVWIAKHYGGIYGHGVERPLGTITARDHHAKVLVTLDPNPDWARAWAIRHFLAEHSNTAFADGLPVVPIDGVPHWIVDIGARMFVPDELKVAQGFPRSYVLDRLSNGQKITPQDQTRLIGNSVVAGLAGDLVALNVDPGQLTPEACERVAQMQGYADGAVHGQGGRRTACA